MPFGFAGDPAPQQLTAPCRKYSGRPHHPLEQSVCLQVFLCFPRITRTSPGSDYEIVTPNTKVTSLARFGLACLGALLVTGTIRAQTIAHGRIDGRVVDARTGAGLAKVAVVVAGHGPGTLTDADGRFVLAAVGAGSIRLYVSVVGYILVQRDVELSAGQTVSLTIPLTEGTGTYTETVTVAADAFRTAHPGVASQQVLGSADLQNLRGVLADDPLRAVQVLPGVATGDDLRSEFSVRGSDFNRMNFTVEGFATPFLLHTVRAIEDRANSGSVAMINSDILEDVALLNGGYPQQHGNRTGAEVDFRLREGSRDRRQLRVAVSGTNASAVVEGPLGAASRGSWLVSARKSYLDLLVRRFRDEGLTFAFSDVQGKVVFDLTPRQKVEVVLLAGASKLRDIDIDDPSEVFVGRNTSAVSVAGWQFGGRRGLLSVRALGAYNSFRNDQTDTRDLDEGDTTQAAARIDGAFTLRRGLQLDAGAQVERTLEARRRLRVSSGVLGTVNDYSGSAVRDGAFVQVRWRPLETVTLIPGLRADRWSLTGEATASPWMTGEWRLPGGLTVRGGTGVYRQFPDFERVIGSLGTTTNTHERAMHFDLGVEGQVTPTTRWQVVLYRRDEENFLRRFGAETRLVNGRVVRGSISTRYQNRLDGETRGVEILLQRRTPNGLSGWISYAYGRNRYEDRLNGESFRGDLDQRHTFNVYAFYRVSARTSVTGKLRLGTNFPAPGYYGGTEGSYVVVDRRNELGLPLYSRLDLRANRTFNWSRNRLTLFAEVMNVLNRDNVRISIPRVNSSTRSVTRLFESMIPIVPSAGILIEF
jgi:hypothetical protein